MKKVIISVCLLMVLLMSIALPAFANDDLDKDAALGNSVTVNGGAVNPANPSVAYTPITRTYKEWTDGTSKQLVLKYILDKPYGETIAMIDDEKDARKIESGIKAHQIDSMLDDGAFLYTKISFKGIKGNSLDAVQVSMIVTKPDNTVVYADGSACAMIGKISLPYMLKGKVYIAYFDVTDMFDQIRNENGGTMPVGQYDFSLFFGGELFTTVSYKFAK